MLIAHKVENYQRHVFQSFWYVCENDMVGGFMINTIDKPASQIDPGKNEFMVAEFMDEEVAKHVAELHNMSITSGMD